MIGVIPKISVILPAYNSMRTIRSCVSSLYKNLRDFEAGKIEVVAPVRLSTDGTREFLTTFPDIKIVDHEEVGISAAYNLGVATCRGCSAIFLNSDDELGDGFIKTLGEIAFRKNPDRHVVYSSVQFIDTNGSSLYERHPAPYFGFIQRHYSIILHPNAIYPLFLLRKHPFEVLPGAPPKDREQVYALMKHAIVSRTRDVFYRYRIWSSSGTVMLASKGGVTGSCRDRIICFFGRILVQSYETKLLSRSFNKIVRGKKSFWINPR